MSFPSDPSALGGMMAGLQQQMEAMKSQRQYMAAQVHGDHIYAIGGKGKFVQYKTIEKFYVF